jgi:hypothetical protein
LRLKLWVVGGKGSGIRTRQLKGKKKKTRILVGVAETIGMCCFSVRRREMHIFCGAVACSKIRAWKKRRFVVVVQDARNVLIKDVVVPFHFSERSLLAILWNFVTGFEILGGIVVSEEVEGMGQEDEQV